MIGATKMLVWVSHNHRGCVSRADTINRSSLTSNSYEHDNDTNKLRFTCIDAAVFLM